MESLHATVQCHAAGPALATPPTPQSTESRLYKHPKSHSHNRPSTSFFFLLSPLSCTDPKCLLFHNPRTTSTWARPATFRSRTCGPIRPTTTRWPARPTTPFRRRRDGRRCRGGRGPGLRGVGGVPGHGPRPAGPSPRPRGGPNPPPLRPPGPRQAQGARSLDNVSGYGLVPISSFFSKLMWSEGFTIAGSPLDHARKLWPHDHRSFCDVIEEYNKAMRDLAGRLLQLMLLSLGLAEEDVNWAGATGEFGDMSTVIQLNSYPACPDPDRAMGLAAHTDSSLFTILFQNRVSGLQVLRPTGRAGPAHWVTVRPIPGAFVVNVGDLLHILSNGRFKSVVHRAVVNRTAHRVSAGFFCGPPHNIKVAPLEKLMEPTKGPAYRAVTWHEYLGLRRKLFDKALQSIKISEEKWEDHSNSSNNTNTNTNTNTNSSKASSVITCV
uniref:Fe2OG dioxygenase domain-containing protein n=1 Tax=Ananas comosus var. bracteatus TaxID=296719 RepID=A0A6V7QJP8_ANACO|nr:unnamed protein product [Ananas comosus var. bracteatus]